MCHRHQKSHWTGQHRDAQVPGQAEAQQPAQPQSHPGIAAEVQIQLQGIVKNSRDFVSAVTRPHGTHVDEIRRQLEGIEADGQGQRRHPSAVLRRYMNLKKNRQPNRTGSRTPGPASPAFPGCIPRPRKYTSAARPAGPGTRAFSTPMTEHQAPQTQQRRPASGRTR